VKSLGKADYERCKHLRRGPIKGCAIYKTRPEDCASYECLWLAGTLPEDFRPDRIGFVLSVSTFTVSDTDTNEEDPDAYIMIHELKAGASRTERANGALEAMGQHVLVMEITRDGLRKVRGGPAHAVQRIMDIARANEAKGIPGYSVTPNPPKETP